MIRRPLTVAVLLAGSALATSSPASAGAPPTIVCFRAPCTQPTPIIQTNAAEAHRPGGYLALGWTCWHDKRSGRVWYCRSPHRTRR